MTGPVILMVLGLLLALGAFVFAALNMVRGVSNFDPKGLFTGHIGAMIVMAIGGVCFWIGAIWGIIALAMMFVR